MLFLNRRHTMSETARDRAHGRCGTRPRGTRSRRGRSTKEKDLQRRSFLDRGVKLARGESPERTFLFLSFFFFLLFFPPCLLSKLGRQSMRDAITVRLAHAISSRRCLLPSYLFFWPPEAAPSRPPLPPLAAAILVISGETQLRYFAPDLGFHSIPRPRAEIRGRKTRGQVYEASSSDVASNVDGGGTRMGVVGIDGSEKESGSVRQWGILTR